MSVPDRPRFVKQLDGSRYAGLNCTCASAAMALDRATLGVHQTTGSYVRALTGDTTGGTTLAQVDAALSRRWGINLDVEYNLSWDSFVARIKAGQGAILQGWEGVTRGTRWSASETFSGNHAWFVNDYISGKGFRVYDPLADGRRDGIAESPLIIPASVVREWAGKLDVSDPAEPYRAIGLGKVYAGFTRDTEPHVHLRYGGVRSRPFPDRTRGAKDGVDVRRSPGTTGTFVRNLSKGQLFIAYQQTEHYLGNHNGNEWVPKRDMRYVGGST